MTKPYKVLVLLFAASVCLSAQTVIDTNPQWNGSTFISSFGVTNTATYGQTITVGSGFGRLVSFSVQVGNCSAATTLRAHVNAWDGTRATGSSFYDSPPRTVASGSGFQQLTFATGAIALAPGQYVLFGSTSEDQTGAPSSACQWGATPDNTPYPAGLFVFLNNGTSTGQWTTSAWSTIGRDLAFRAAFDGVNPVPTLSEWGMILLSCLLVGGGYFWLRERDRVGVPAE